jgi:hypothetical protein
MLIFVLPFLVCVPVLVCRLFFPFLFHPLLRPPLESFRSFLSEDVPEQKVYNHLFVVSYVRHTSVEQEDEASRCDKRLQGACRCHAARAVKTLPWSRAKTGEANSAPGAARACERQQGRWIVSRTERGGAIA